MSFEQAYKKFDLPKSKEKYQGAEIFARRFKICTAYTYEKTTRSANTIHSKDLKKHAVME